MPVNASSDASASLSQSVALRRYEPLENNVESKNVSHGDDVRFLTSENEALSLEISILIESTVPVPPIVKESVVEPVT